MEINYDYFRQIFDYRELILALALKEIKMKYKSAVLGMLWAILNPLFFMLIFWMVFTLVFKMEIKNYPLFLMAALLPWFYFSFSLTQSTTSIIENASLLKKANFPAEIIPLSVIAANLFNFVISLLLLLMILPFFRIFPKIQMLGLILVVFLQILFVLGISLAAAALNTVFRDIKYMIELFMIVWFYATPIFYPLSFVPERLRFWFYLNPLTHFINVYRELLMNQRSPGLVSFWPLIFFGLAFCLLGFSIFFKLKKNFVDLT